MKLTEALKIILEFEDKDLMTGFYDPSEDKIGQRQLDDTRKTTLTLKHLNRLKKIRATKKLAQLQKRGLLNLMYGASSGEEGGGEAPF